MEIFDSLKNFWNKLSDLCYNGKKWIGGDGLINLETAALVTIFLKHFFPLNWAMIFTGAISVAKSTLDKSNGHENETHDLICMFIGMMLGAML